MWSVATQRSLLDGTSTAKEALLHLYEWSRQRQSCHQVLLQYDFCKTWLLRSLSTNLCSEGTQLLTISCKSKMQNVHDRRQNMLDQYHDRWLEWLDEQVDTGDQETMHRITSGNGHFWNKFSVIVDRAVYLVDNVYRPLEFPISCKFVVPIQPGFFKGSYSDCGIQLVKLAYSAEGTAICLKTTVVYVLFLNLFLLSEYSFHFNLFYFRVTRIALLDTSPSLLIFVFVRIWMEEPRPLWNSSNRWMSLRLTCIGVSCLLLNHLSCQKVVMTVISAFQINAKSGILYTNTSFLHFDCVL